MHRNNPHQNRLVGSLTPVKSILLMVTSPPISKEDTRSRGMRCWNWQNSRSFTFTCKSQRGHKTSLQSKQNLINHLHTQKSELFDHKQCYESTFSSSYTHTHTHTHLISIRLDDNDNSKVLPHAEGRLAESPVRNLLLLLPLSVLMAVEDHLVPAIKAAAEVEGNGPAFRRPTL